MRAYMYMYVRVGDVRNRSLLEVSRVSVSTVLPAKSDSDVMFCLKSYQGLIIDRSLVY